MKTSETIKEFIARTRASHGTKVCVTGGMNPGTNGECTYKVQFKDDKLFYEILADKNGNIVTLDAIYQGKRLNLRDNR